VHCGPDDGSVENRRTDPDNAPPIRFLSICTIDTGEDLTQLGGRLLLIFNVTPSVRSGLRGWSSLVIHSD
jgi:hypothetical protein